MYKLKLYTNEYHNFDMELKRIPNIGEHIKSGNDYYKINIIIYMDAGEIDAELFVCKCKDPIHREKPKPLTKESGFRVEW